MLTTQFFCATPSIFRAVCHKSFVAVTLYFLENQQLEVDGFNFALMSALMMVINQVSFAIIMTGGSQFDVYSMKRRCSLICSSTPSLHVAISSSRCVNQRRVRLKTNPNFKELVHIFSSQNVYYFFYFHFSLFFFYIFVVSFFIFIVFHCNCNGSS